MAGNICAHIYTDGNFIHISPMRYKSESVILLENMNPGKRSCKQDIMENATEQTGYNTEIQEISRQAIMYICTTYTYSPCKNKVESIIIIIIKKIK